VVILFDLDGTLIDSTEAIVESFGVACKKHNYPIQKESDIKKLIGHPLDEMFRRVGVEEERVWDFVDTYKMHYREISTQKTELLEDAKKAVLEAKKFARLGIVTTKTGKYSRELMEHFGLMEYFEVLIGREDVEHPKPHAEPIEKALDRFSNLMFNESIWIIGDTEMDLISAKNAGIKSIAVLSGYGIKEELEQHTSVVVEDVLEAVKYLNPFLHS
jgi:phosphoglycolate phosphatase